MDAYIDPTTHDYELLEGVITRDPANGLTNACFMRLAVPLGSYWADRTFGSRLHELQRLKDVPRMSKLARQYAEQALQPILDDGRASKITVTTEQPHNGRLYLLIRVVADSNTFAFKHPVSVI